MAELIELDGGNDVVVRDWVEPICDQNGDSAGFDYELFWEEVELAQIFRFRPLFGALACCVVSAPSLTATIFAGSRSISVSRVTSLS